MSLQYKYFIFSHLPKSGGTYIGFTLRNLWEIHQVKHTTLCLTEHRQPLYSENNIKFINCEGLFALDEKFHPETTIETKRNSVFVLGCVRNPFDYYLSVWAFGCKNSKNTGGPLQRIRMWHNNLLPLYEDSYNIDNFQQWLNIILQPRMSPVWDIGVPSLSRPVETEIRQNDVGMLSYRTCSLYFNGSYDKFLNVDNINGNTNHIISNHGRETNSVNNQICEILNQIGINNDIENLNLINQTYKKHKTSSNDFIDNKTRHLPYVEYYNNKTKQLVEHKDRYIFEKYGFKFGE